MGTKMQNFNILKIIAENEQNNLCSILYKKLQRSYTTDFYKQMMAWNLSAAFKCLLQILIILLLEWVFVLLLDKSFDNTLLIV